MAAADLEAIAAATFRDGAAPAAADAELCVEFGEAVRVDDPATAGFEAQGAFTAEAVVPAFGVAAVEPAIAGLSFRCSAAESVAFSEDLIGAVSGVFSNLLSRALSAWPGDRCDATPGSGLMSAGAAIVAPGSATWAWAAER